MDPIKPNVTIRNVLMVVIYRARLAYGRVITDTLCVLTRMLQPNHLLGSKIYFRVVTLQRQTNAKKKDNFYICNENFVA